MKKFEDIVHWWWLAIILSIAMHYYRSYMPGKSMKANEASNKYLKQILSIF